MNRSLKIFPTDGLTEKRWKIEKKYIMEWIKIEKELYLSGKTPEIYYEGQKIAHLYINNWVNDK